MTTAASENEDDIDDEETGGEWITEDNIHKYLSHGVLLPIAPTDAEIGENVPETTDASGTATITSATGEEEERKEPENADFPSFDENMLPSMVELDAK